jgi:hypothetical protein
MSKIKRINGDPENSVFAVKGELVTNDQGEVFIKKFDDRLNSGWVKMPAPQEIQFEKIVIEANSVGGLSNLSPTLRFQIPSGTAIIKIEAEVSSSEQTNIRVVLNGNSVINETNTTSAEYISNELNAGVHSVICTTDSEVNSFVRLTITKVGGYGNPLIGAQALGEISATKEVVLKVFGTNYYSRGKARFFDVTTNDIAVGSDYEYNLQTDTINNPSDFIGGGTKVFMGKAANIYEGRGRVEIADFGGDYINVADLTQSLFWLEAPLLDKVTSSFLQGTAGDQFYKLVNPNNFSISVDYTISIPMGSDLTTGSGESNNYFKDNVLVLDGNSSTLSGLSTSSFTASYNGSLVEGGVLLEIGGVEGLYPLKYEQFVVPVTTTTTTPEPTTTTTAEPTTTTTTAEPTTTTTTTEEPITTTTTTTEEPTTTTTTTTTTPEPDCLEYTVAPIDFLETYEITYIDCDGNPQTISSTTAQNFCTRDFSSINDTFGEPGSLATTTANVTGPNGPCP